MFVRAFLFSLIFVLAVVGTRSANAQATLTLSSAAAAHGFMAIELRTNAAVVLSRPGVSILVRPDDIRYYVNQAIRYSDRAPQKINNELYVSVAFDAALSALAIEHPWPATALSSSTLPASRQTGSITAMAMYRPGTDTIEISGLAPAGMTIRIILMAQISRDLPSVSLDRIAVTTAADGRYFATASASSLTFTQSKLYAQVTDNAGTSVTSALVPVQRPNEAIKTLNDDLPKT